MPASGVIVGYSGLDGSQELKLREFPGLDQREQRLFQGLDSAAAILVDDEIVAAVQQERFTGVKFDHSFPREAIDYCLRQAGARIEDVRAVCHNFDYSRLRPLSAGSAFATRRFDEIYAPVNQTLLLQRHYPELRGRMRVTPVDHHHAHALTAVAGSGFGEALVVVTDGMGELQAITVHEWRGGRLTRLAAMDFRSSLGLFYALVTMHLGFWPNSDEYKVMALAATGDEDRFAAVLDQAVLLQPGGRITVPVLGHNTTLRERETFAGSRQWLAARGCPSRQAGEPLAAVHFDVAAAAQRRLEQALSHIVFHWLERTGLNRVAMAGGVALNCVAAGKLAASPQVAGLYVQPAAGDEGTAVGAALAGADLDRAIARYPAMTFLGPDVTEGQPPSDGGPYWRQPVAGAVAEEAAARLLAQGCITGWAQGRLEFGPRALGNRSILADPRRRETRDRVNAAVKFREGFRPLAPVVKMERAGDYFVIPAGAGMRHMTVAVPVRAHRQEEIAAVVHDDGTARVQCVHQAEVPRLWQILDRFERLTGVPVLVNTSLNVKGQPTARDGFEAFRTFHSSSLDVVFIGDTCYAKADWAQRAAQAIAEAEAEESAAVTA
jgi:carbamoyltransferase